MTTFRVPENMTCCYRITGAAWARCGEHATVLRMVGRYDVAPLCATHDQLLSQASAASMTKMVEDAKAAFADRMAGRAIVLDSISVERELRRPYQRWALVTTQKQGGHYGEELWEERTMEPRDDGPFVRFDDLPLHAAQRVLSAAELSSLLLAGVSRDRTLTLQDGAVKALLANRVVLGLCTEAAASIEKDRDQLHTLVHDLVEWYDACAAAARGGAPARGSLKTLVDQARQLLSKP